jgi:hypothetical protein
VTEPVLPEQLRSTIIELFREGRSSLEVYDLVYQDAIRHVDSEGQLSRCIASLKGKAVPLSGGNEEPKSAPVILPSPKSFDTAKHQNIISSLSETMSGKDFEKACQPIVTDILMNYEGFTDIIDSNDVKGFHNPPFDFLAFRGDKPFIIEFKGSLDNFNSPGETQKRRMLKILKRIKDLNIALLQVKLKKSQYRILYNRELELFFDGREAPLEPVVEWILDRIEDHNS